jgi:L-iditol 2-dehydrogenase
MTQNSAMQAALLYGAGDLRVGEAPRPTITHPDDVLIRIHACGICPSDLRVYAGMRPAHGKLPSVPGHEWAGEVLAVGEEVQDFKPGERVVPSWRVVCGRCYYCVRGIWNYCENLLQGRVRGGFGEYGVAPARSLLLIPEGVSYEEASFCEPLACCLNGSHWSGVSLGHNVVIIGAGPIGLTHLQLARVAGARTISVDLMAERLEKARELGASETIDARQEDPVQKVKVLTEGHGADVVIVAVGAPQAQQQALEMAGLCATVNYFAGTYPSATIPLDPNLIHYKQIRLTGSHDFSPLDFRNALHSIAHGLVRVAPMVSHHLPLAQVKEGFDIVAGQKGLKVMIRTAAG